MSAWTTATPTGLRNVHTRVTDGTLADAARLINALGTPDDRLWPRDRWPRMRLDHPVAVGSRGGHAGVRYRVLQVDAGRRLRLEFEPGSRPALTGWHEFRVDPIGPDGLLWTHELLIERPSPTVRTALLPLHDALLEDLFDQAESVLGQHALERTVFSTGVRARRALLRPVRRRRTHAAAVGSRA